MHYNAGSYVAVDGNTGNRPRSGTDRTSFQDDEAGAAFPFPHLSPDSEAARQISINFIANILGLGWAATPAGLKAMEELKKEAEGSGHGGFAGDPVTATTDMCTFLILNISSLQLIPVNMIAYRSQYGSPSPAAITGPCLAATAASTIAAVIFCKIMGRKK